jgi:hypothetical protein
MRPLSPGAVSFVCYPQSGNQHLVMATVSGTVALIEDEMPGCARGRRQMTDLLFAIIAYAVCQVALFGLALLAYVHWRVPVRDLAVLLRECRPVFPRRGRPKSGFIVSAVAVRGLAAR